MGVMAGIFYPKLGWRFLERCLEKQKIEAGYINLSKS
tara:strand:+ start:1354 stop:1464 length:111 start_codon:yes stop_codon:yes gene_type:complete